jgi:hypothetical protein
MAILRQAHCAVKQWGVLDLPCKELPHLRRAPCPHDSQKPSSHTLAGHQANSTRSLALSVPKGPLLLLGDTSLASSSVAYRSRI